MKIFPHSFFSLSNIFTINPDRKAAANTQETESSEEGTKNKTKTGGRSQTRATQIFNPFYRPTPDFLKVPKKGAQLLGKKKNLLRLANEMVKQRIKDMVRLIER